MLQFWGPHGTTRYTCERTTRRWPPVVGGKLNAPEQRRRLLPRSGGQGVAGSNLAVPTGNDIFSNTLLPHQSQQKSHSFVKWPFYGRADRVPRLPYGHVPTRQSRPRPTAKKSKITQPPHIRTANPANGEPAGAIRARRRYSICGTRAGQGAQARPAHAAADARRPAPEPSLG